MFAIISVTFGSKKLSFQADRLKLLLTSVSGWHMIEGISLLTLVHKDSKAVFENSA